MKVCGIIAEYNPFHKGHLYHIEKTKELINYDYLIVVMSGNYTQRGLPAIFDKYERTNQALAYGADLVLELPAVFSTSSAEGFAFGAVSLLHKLNVCNFLSFGSETGKNDSLPELVSFLNSEPVEYKETLQQFLKEGLNFPAAKEKALSYYFPKNILTSFNNSNNILALEYCRALNTFNSNIEPLWIKRKGNQYNDSELSKSGSFSSATSIRKHIKEHISKGIDFKALQNDIQLKTALPEVFFSKSEVSLKSLSPIFPEDFSLLYRYCLLNHTPSSLISFEGISASLSDRIYGKLNEYKNFETFCDLLKTKELTYSRISRSLLHVLLGITKEDVKYYQNHGYCPYAKVLGFKKSSVSLLHEIKKQSSIPLITKMASASVLLEAQDYFLFEKEIKASHIYESVKAEKYGLSFKNEYKKTPVII